MYTPWPRLGILGWMASKYGHGRGALETIYMYTLPGYDVYALAQVGHPRMSGV